MKKKNKYQIQIDRFIYKIKFGFEQTYFIFWEWWLCLHPDYNTDEFWECIDLSDPQNECPWDAYLNDRNTWVTYFQIIEKAQGTNVWSEKKIDTFINNLTKEQHNNLTEKQC